MTILTNPALPREIQIRDIAIGFTAMIGNADTPMSVMGVIENALTDCTHETIYEKAKELAVPYGKAFTAAETDFVEISEKKTNCFMVNRPLELTVCACMLGGQLGAPTDSMYPGMDSTVYAFTVQTLVKH